MHVEKLVPAALTQTINQLSKLSQSLCCFSHFFKLSLQFSVVFSLCSLGIVLSVCVLSVINSVLTFYTGLSLFSGGSADQPLALCDFGSSLSAPSL